MTYNIAVIADVSRPKYDASAIVNLLGIFLVGKGIWTAIPGMFAFQSNANVVEVQEVLSKEIDHFLVVNFNAAQVDGQLEDDEWTSWLSGMGKKNAAAMLAFHGETVLTVDDFIGEPESKA